MARQFTRSRGRLGSPRKTTWFSIDVDSEANDGSASISHSMTAVELAKRPFTVIRTYLQVKLSSDQSAASETQVAGIGLCVVSDQAAAIGVTAVPTPLTDLESDLWFVHQVMMNEFLFATGVAFISGVGEQYSIDSKAMRKVNDDEQILIVQEGSNVVGNGLITVTGGRLLIKEH